MLNRSGRRIMLPSILPNSSQPAAPRRSVMRDESDQLTNIFLPKESALIRGKFPSLGHMQVGMLRDHEILVGVTS